MFVLSAAEVFMWKEKVQCRTIRVHRQCETPVSAHRSTSNGQSKEDEEGVQKQKEEDIKLN